MKTGDRVRSKTGLYKGKVTDFHNNLIKLWCEIHDNYVLVRPDDLELIKVQDPVNHPKHYTSHPSGVECIQITEHMTFNIGNVFKYCWRSGLKDGESNIQDLKKAQWYLNREIQRIENRES